MSNEMKRRDFLSLSAMLGASAIAAPAVLSSCKSEAAAKPWREKGTYYVPELPDKAVAGRELKCGVIGCGGRATGAAGNLLDAADGIKIHAICDIFPDRTEAFVKTFKEKGVEIPAENIFHGFDAYKQVIDSGVDMVIIATPPVFRPDHFKYATEKGVHSFLEKPICVDAKGYRTIMATAKQAESKGLSVVTGTQRHHQREYVEAFQKIQEGIIGDIVSGNVYWNQGMLWYKERQAGWSDMEWMIRDWVNWKWLSGDHIVEQHVHNIDVFLWMSGMRPIKATGVGSRNRRITGDQYDQFSIDYEFENNVHLHAFCRQIDGTSTRVGEVIQGTKGSWSSEAAEIYDLQGNVIWKYEADPQYKQNDAYVLEHVDWVNHIRKGTMHVEAGETGISSMVGAMGREAAYTGQTVEWDQISASDLDYMAPKLELGTMDMSDYTVRVPGSAK